MKRLRSELALRRVLDALEAELLAVTPEEIQAVIAETGMSAKALLSDGGMSRKELLADLGKLFGFMKSPSPLEGEVSDAEHRRVGGMAQPSHNQRAGGDSTPHPDPGAERPVCASQPAASSGGSDLPLKGGGG
jgi:hypothetical protein